VRILTVNAGSTSVKVSLLDDDRTVGEYDGLEAALEDGDRLRQLDAVAHRVVHGGERTAPARVDDELREELERLVEMAPLHQPPALAALDSCRTALPDVPHVACFDTTFHTSLPRGARTYAIPRRLRTRVHVYGFHGLSHAWSARRVAELAPEASRLVVAHLGGGESLCAVNDGHSVMTTMGFTPLDGLVMATRSGTIDPGAVLWLARHTDEDLDRVLEKESGLLGLCGSGDMREVLCRADAGDDEAALALEVYTHRLLRLLGGCVAALEGLDALVFTGGVGENSARVRELVTERLGWLDVRTGDPSPVSDGGPEDLELTAAGSRVRSFVIRAREDLQMAAEVRALLTAG